MASFKSLNVNSVVKIIDPSFIRGVSNPNIYRDTCAIVIGKDNSAETIQIKLFDGNVKWAKATRVANSLEIVE